MSDTTPLLSIDEIKEHLQHPDTGVRYQAISDIISLRNPDLVPELEQCLSKETDIKNLFRLRKGIQALKNIKDNSQLSITVPDSTLEKIEAALRSGDMEQSNKAFHYILHYRLRQYVAEMETIANENDSSYQKCLLLRFFTALDGEAYYETILTYLSDDDPRVVSSAIEALEEIGNTKSLASIAWFTDHQNHRIRSTAIKALVRLGDSTAMELLTSMACSENLSWRKAATWALKELKLPECRPVIEKLAEDPDISIRDAALVTLSTLPQSVKKDEEPNKQKGFQEKTALDKINELKRLGRPKNQQAIQVLFNLLEQEQDLRVIATLITTIGRLRNPMSVNYLMPFLKSDDDRIRANTVEALGAVLAPPENQILLSFLNDHCNRVVGNAITALYKEFPDQCIAALRGLAESLEVNEQLTAVWCLGSLTDMKLLVHLKPILLSTHDHVRNKLFQLLEVHAPASPLAKKVLSHYFSDSLMNMDSLPGLPVIERANVSASEITFVGYMEDKSKPISLQFKKNGKDWKCTRFELPARDNS
jgi:HEAT repeat protein